MAESSMAAETDETRKRLIALYRGASKGKWDIVESILSKSPEDVQAKTSKVGDTVLHVAAIASHAYFVKQLVEKMKLSINDLRKKNDEQNTAFCLAVVSGNMEIVKFMMSKDRELVKIKGENDMLPLQIAALFGHGKIVDHLYTDNSYLDDQNRIDLLVTLIDNHLYDTALQLLSEHKKLATSRAAGNGETASHALVRNSLNFSSMVNRNQNQILKSFFKCTKMVQEKRMHPAALELVRL